MSTEIIKAEVLTPDAFKPFGRVFGMPDTAPDIEREYLSWWGGLYDLDFPDIASLGFLRFKRTDFTITAMERHMKAAEVFIPVRGTGVIPFAPASAAAEGPDISRLKVFIVETGTALVIDRSIWHFPGFAVTEIMDFFLTVRKNSADDVEMKDIPPVNIVL
ncbi:MAG: hypothetical protein E4H36_03030 [Spirochaetales bacterium]|nr:MAG: hypothetical protein E4H36_03030 [Spirochaetales bacterium]